MCGIAGIIDFEKTPQPSALKPMLSSLAHRGHDAEGEHYDNNVAFGHRRLSIIDLSTNANQPFFDTNKRYVMVFNGEIYNYQQVKSQLNYSWQSTSDTEVILAAYIKWGVKCLDYLNGMFAFAIYDTIEKELFVARDRLGVKPFYYYTSITSFVFASEVRAIIQSGYVSSNIDKMALNGYLSELAIQTPHTIIDGIKQLCPGEYGIFKNGTFTTERYWSIVPQQKITENKSDESYNETVQKTRLLLEHAIKSRMVADVNVGAFLSGGIDSSAIVALMAKYAGRPIDTFSIVFEDKRFDEREYAQLVARKFNTNHTELELDPKELITHLDDYFDSMDSPTVDGINTWMVSKLVSTTGIKVALSGLGGDELFAGYTGFQRWKKMTNNKSIIKSLPFKVGISALNTIQHKRSNLKLDIFTNHSDQSFNSFYSINRANFVENEIKQLIADKSNFTKHKDWLDLNYKNITQLPVYSQYSIAELSYYTLNVLLRDTDQMSMRWALEIREPFFDYQLVEYLLTVPDKYKYNKNTPKKLLVDSMGDLLPAEIVYRPKKGFSFPWDSWIRNELKEYCYLSLMELSKSNLFDSKAINDIWKRFIENDKRVNWVQIWSLVVIQKWLSKI